MGSKWISRSKSNSIKVFLNLVILSGLIFAVMCSTIGCNKNKEAVITDNGEDITQEQKVYDTLEASSAKKFSYNDLTVGNVRYKMTDAEIEAVYGKPDKVVDMVAAQPDAEAQSDTQAAGRSDVESSEKAYVYADKVFAFYYMEGAYRLVSVESASSADTFSRGLSVGKTFEDILNAYYRDENCMNNNYYSEDSTAILGKFLYGSYTMDSLESVKPSGAVEYGVINFNGYASLEEADSYIVELTYFEPPYKSGVATTSDDLAQIAFDIDKDGKITSIRWYYYPELQD